ncbi:MAG: cytochrome P450 [Myxococcota bacterium]|nr:cytochrome P450 [Myxococcota bacterium]
MAESFNPFDPEFTRDPYPTYARMRDEAAVARVRIGIVRMLRMGAALIAMQRKRGGGPGLRQGLGVVWSRIRSRRTRPLHDKRPRFGRLYTVSRFDEVSHVLRHPEFFSSEVMGGSQPEVMNADGDIAPTSGALIAHDPPEHTQQRNIVNRGFTPRKIAALEPRVRKIAEELFASFQGEKQCDLMAQFANPLPVSVIADLLGLDPARRDDFKRWSTALIVGSTRPGEGSGFASNWGMFREFRSYMTQVIQEREQNPGEDLISTLIHTGEGEGILDREQVISFATLMLAAGSETTTNLIGNAMLALFRDEDLLARVQNDPQLIPQVVEETLRYDSPIQLTMRLAMQETEVGGVQIPKGAIVAALLASANRDESHFEHPERFDIDRATPNHLAFGFGNHFCIGASLARMEGRIGLEMILTRLAGLELTVPPEDIEPHGSFLVRGPSSLPVRFTA